MLMIGHNFSPHMSKYIIVRQPLLFQAMQSTKKAHDSIPHSLVLLPDYSIYVLAIDTIHSKVCLQPFNKCFLQLAYYVQYYTLLQQMIDHYISDIQTV